MRYYIREDGDNGYNLYDRWTPHEENETGHRCVHVGMSYAQVRNVQRVLDVRAAGELIKAGVEKARVDGLRIAPASFGSKEHGIVCLVGAAIYAEGIPMEAISKLHTKSARQLCKGHARLNIFLATLENSEAVLDYVITMWDNFDYTPEYIINLLLEYDEPLQKVEDEA